MTFERRNTIKQRIDDLMTQNLKRFWVMQELRQSLDDAKREHLDATMEIIDLQNELDAGQKAMGSIHLA